MDCEDAQKASEVNGTSGLGSETGVEQASLNTEITEKSALDRETSNKVCNDDEAENNTKANSKDEAVNGAEQKEHDTKAAERTSTSDTKQAEEKMDNGDKQADKEMKSENTAQSDGKIDDNTQQSNEIQKQDGEQAEKQNGDAEVGAVGGTAERNLNGKYNHVKSENMDEFLRAIGIPWLMRKMFKKFNHSTDIVQDGDKFDIKLYTGFMTKEWKFTVGEDFDDKSMGFSNDMMVVHPEWDGNKLILKSVPKNEKAKAKPMTVTRYLTGDELTMVMEVDNIVCTRVFKRKN